MDLCQNKSVNHSYRQFLKYSYFSQSPKIVNIVKYANLISEILENLEVILLLIGVVAIVQNDVTLTLINFLITS